MYKAPGMLQSTDGLEAQVRCADDKIQLVQDAFVGNVNAFLS